MCSGCYFVWKVYWGIIGGWYMCNVFIGKVDFVMVGWREFELGYRRVFYYVVFSLR